MINLESLLSGFAGNLNPAVAGSISVVIGLLALLFGYRLFRAYLFVVGFAVGTIAASAVTELPMALLCGLLAGLACIVLWYVGLFLLGAACGVLLTLALGITFTPLVVAVAILFGILAVVIRKLMIIVSTSWTGAGMILGVVGPGSGTLWGCCWPRWRWRPPASCASTCSRPARSSCRRARVPRMRQAAARRHQAPAARQPAAARMVPRVALDRQHAKRGLSPCSVPACVLARGE